MILDSVIYQILSVSSGLREARVREANQVRSLSFRQREQRRRRPKQCQRVVTGFADEEAVETDNHETKDVAKESGYSAVFF